MEILYVSKLSSKRLLNDLFVSGGMNAGFAVQKFGRLITRGLVLNGVACNALSSLPIGKQLLYRRKSEVEDGMGFHYIPSVRIPIIRHIILFFHSFFYILFWGMKNKKDKAIVFDVLDISICIGGLWASKVCGVKSVGVMTDMPGLMVGQGKSLWWRIVAKVNMSYVSSFDAYVFLTEQMNECINKKRHPFIIMEGLVDSEISYQREKKETNNERVVMYAGGLHKRYGLKMLVDAFVSLRLPQTRLVIFGKGPYETELLEVCSHHKSVEYKGVAPNDTVVKMESSATLLVNPRPTYEEFTQYSFPSKNMEYMVSGTPLLTTRLPGMPKEYYDYVYLFEEESEKGYASVLNELLTLPSSELELKGERAREFVLREKNNRTQCERIINLIKTIQ